MKNSLHRYWAAVTGGAVVFCVLLDWSVLTALSASDWAGLFTFILLGILSQYLAIESTLGAAKPVKSSIAFVPLLAVAVVMPPPAAVLAAATMSVVDECIFRKRELGRGLFNIAQGVLTLGLAALLFHRLLPPTGLEGVGLIGLLIRFYALALTMFTANVLLVSIGVALRQSERLSIVITHAVGKGGGNLISDFLASPLALLAAYLYETLHVAGLFIVVIPLLYVRRSYLSGVRLEQANRDLLYVLVKAIETRDPYTSGHSVRVATLSRMIGLDAGLRPSVASQVEDAALLHDIGKIDARFADIISKPADLTKDERELIQSHALAGSEMLETLTSVKKEVVVGVRHHHERYDGFGYPDGLTGKNIPVAARIIMIADAVDAMLSDRPYRDALSIDEVRSELLRCSGTQFDPELVAAILKNNTLERAEQLIERAGANGRRQTPVS